MRRLKEFIPSNDGLATIEWIALTAVAFVAAVAISGIVLNSADGMGGAIAEQMDEAAEEISGD